MSGEGSQGVPGSHGDRGGHVGPASSVGGPLKMPGDPMEYARTSQGSPSIEIVNNVSQGLEDIQRNATEHADIVIRRIKGVEDALIELFTAVGEMRKDVGVLAGRKSMLAEMYEDFQDRKRAEARKRFDRALRWRRVRGLGLAVVGGFIAAMAVVGLYESLQNVLVP